MGRDFTPPATARHRHMDLLKEFFSGKSAARLLMIAALLLLTVSQFFLYHKAEDSSFLVLEPNFRGSTLYMDLDAHKAATGWELHPHAYIIQLLLAFALLRDDIAESGKFLRFGYWLCAVLIFAATLPGTPMRAQGAGMGGIATLMAIAAAVLHQATHKPAASNLNHPSS